jgi:hypothetical protein
MNVQPFTVQVPEAELVDLQTRLARTRWPDEVAGAEWEYGTSLAYLHELVRYRQERFDWRAQERAINTFAHFRATVGGVGIHVIHQRGNGGGPAPALIITRRTCRTWGQARELSAAEQAFQQERERWLQTEGGYGQIQRTKPQTLADGLNDSPAGLAAWIVEKFRVWSDCDGDVERRFSKAELLTNIAISWFTQTIGASTRLYDDGRQRPR